VANENLDSQISKARTRVASLHKRAGDGVLHQQGLLPEAFQELHTTMEELQVAEEELRQQNEMLAEAFERIEAESARYHDLFELAPDGYLVTDMHGIIREANRAATRMLRIGVKYLIGKPLTSTIVPEDVRDFRLQLLEAAKMTDTQTWDVRMQRRQSGSFHASLTVGIIRRGGEADGLRWLVRDVTVQKQAEERVKRFNSDLEERVRERIAELQAALVREQEAIADLQASHRRAAEEAALMETILATMPTGFAFLDPEGCFVRINQTLCAVNGLSAEEHLGRHFTQILPEALCREIDPLFRRALSGEAVLDKQITAATRMKPDTPRHVLVSYYPVCIEGRILGVGVVVRDITQRIQEKEALSRALDREHRIAETLQRSLLQTVPTAEFPALSIATFYEPALAEAQVGGDFFDVFALDGDRVALVVGDVSGKGLAAAACTAEIKYTLRAFLRTGHEPEQALAELNDFMCSAGRYGDWDHDLFVVLSLAIIDPKSARADISLAGSEPVLILREQGGIESVETKGLLLGIEPRKRYAKSSVTLGPRDMLLMATDGITEARRRSEFLGLDGLKALMEQARSAGSLQQMGEAILRWTKEFSGGSLHDDACILLARLQAQ
jgi:PAS domain S-box-containing protein